jgi:NDP-sugar pyrophosphorylase family protein
MPMHAMILAAGRGTRLGELGETVPKVLVDVAGEPLLARQITYLKDNGIERIVINAHHLADQIQDFGATHPRSSDITVLVEPELLGTAGGVRNALSHLGEDPFVVLYGDVITDEPINPILKTHRRTQATATLTVYQSREVDGKGTVEIDPDGIVSAFHEKTAASIGEEAYINAGLYILDPSLIEDLPTGASLDFGHDVFPSALAQGQTIAGHILAALVIDMGTPAMLDLARRELR